MDLKPEWHRSLPEHLRPDEDKVEDLEALRKRLDFSHELFMRGIANSRWAVIKAQEATLNKLKTVMPTASEKELLRGVLFSRLEMKLKMPGPFDPPKDEILNKIKNLDGIMADINNFSDLIDYILKMEELYFDDGDPIQKQIDEILLDEIVESPIDIEKAIPVNSVGEEYDYVSNQYCDCDGSFVVIKQGFSYLPFEHDRLITQCEKCAKRKEFVFDISSFFHKYKEFLIKPRRIDGSFDKDSHT